MTKTGERLLMVGGLAFSVLCGVVYWQEYRETSTLSSRGLEIDATLDDSYTENLRNNIPHSYTVTYEFLVGGKTYQNGLGLFCQELAGPRKKGVNLKRQRQALEVYPRCAKWPKTA
jgi:hypothetical protein